MLSEDAADEVLFLDEHKVGDKKVLGALIASAAQPQVLTSKSFNCVER